ncbi:MAG: GntR family transcriptional regulator [Pseudomonadales bacterium]|nr:FadR family transcriptional regulator [Pseudomonadales bacterium]NIX06857.1 GntR family transcriptional regulator [Pseudomonadales bacterium]
MAKHEEIAESLTQDILGGQYRTGERLPSERDLAVRFDANRGAVREAMKKLEQLGIANIQPGGARVAPLQEASLDVIGHMLAMGDVPDSKLVLNIIEVISALVRLAVESALSTATDVDIERLRDYNRPLFQEGLDDLDHMEARLELMGAIMSASDNLACQLIARSLLLQLRPRTEPLKAFAQFHTEAHADNARRLDLALANRDADALRLVFADGAALTRESVLRSFEAYEAAQRAPLTGVAAS